MIIRLTLITLGSVAFGMLDALLYFHAETFWLANLSSAYLVLAFVAGAGSGRRSLPVPAVAGAGATVLALFSFYATQVLQHIGGPHFDHARFARYALPGLVSGPVFGMLGAVWATRRSWWALLPLAAALCLEPVAWRERIGYGPGSAWTWTLERSAGLAVAALAAASGLSRRARRNEPPA